MIGIGGPKLDSRVVRPRSNQLRVNHVEVHGPTPLFVLLKQQKEKVCVGSKFKIKRFNLIKYLVGFDPLGRARVPDGHRPLIVGADQTVLVEEAPGDAADLGVASHLDSRVVNVHHVLQDDAIIVDLDSLGHAFKINNKTGYNSLNFILLSSFAICFSSIPAMAKKSLSLSNSMEETMLALLNMSAV